MSTTPAMPVVNLSPHDWTEVCRILRQQVPTMTVWAFGSRVSGSAKPYSDLDLALITKRPLSLTELATIKEAFDDSDLTIRVDLVDWAAASQAFREIIMRDRVVIQEGSLLAPVD